MNVRKKIFLQNKYGYTLIFNTNILINNTCLNIYFLIQFERSYFVATIFNGRYDDSVENYTLYYTQLSHEFY